MTKEERLHKLYRQEILNAFKLGQVSKAYSRLNDLSKLTRNETLD
jgi:hypothetical protein